MKNNNIKSAEYKIKKELKEAFIIKPLSALFLVVLATILFTITGIWQLVLVSGFIGGFFCKRAKMGILIGFLGVFLGWIFLFIYYVLTTEMMYFFEFWVETTMGYPKEIAYYLMLISSLFGGFIGALGGLNGVRIKFFIIEKINKRYLN